jgi:hypothetical protein
MAETAKEEEFLTEKSAEYQNLIEDRLLAAYTRIRTSVRNGSSCSIERGLLQDHSYHSTANTEISRKKKSLLMSIQEEY